MGTQVVDLKRELKMRGLSIVGNKSELIARLKQSVRGKEGSADEEGIGEEIVQGKYIFLLICF